MPNTPLVSIIIPTHNRPEMLLDALASIAAQTMTDWEAIIVDDCSTPAVNAQGIKARFGNKFRVLRHKVAQGGPTAKNTGINAAKGKYLAFLDDDDRYASSYLALAMETLENNPHINTLFMGVACFGRSAEWAQNDFDSAMEKTLTDAQGTKESNYLYQFDDRLFPALLKRVPMPFQRPVTSRANFLQVGLYQANCLLWDCDWALRAALHNICGLLDVGLYLQRTDGQGYSSTPTRRLEHTLSGYAIKKQLLTHPRAAAYKTQLIDAVIVSGRDVAWEYMNQGKGINAFFTVLGTLRYGISVLQLKFLLHALYSCVRKNA